MRLAIVRRRFASAGGAERFIANTTAALAGLGAEVTLVAEGIEGAGVGAEHWLRLPAAKGSRSRRYRAFQQAVASALSQQRFDIVQAHERILGADIFRAGDGVHAAWVERLGRERSPWLRPLMALDPYHRLMMEAERRMVRDSDTIFVANSTLVERELADLLHVPASRLRLIENGVDLAHFRPPSAEERAAARQDFGLAPDEPVAAFVGSGFERKGAFQFVTALARRPLSGVSGLVAGRDKHAARLVRLASRLGVSERTRLLGAVEDVRPILHAADIFVLPTLYDPMPNAALEAIACGLPVVTTADAGIADHIGRSGAGAVTTRDPDDIADKAAATLARLSAARAAAETLRGHFELEDKTRQWLRLYRELT